MNFLENIEEITGNQYAAKGQTVNDARTTIDTGSYVLNALLSGSIYGGASSNSVTNYSGESSTGKCARGTELITVYVDEKTAKKLNLI